MYFNHQLDSYLHNTNCVYFWLWLCVFFRLCITSSVNTESNYKLVLVIQFESVPKYHVNYFNMLFKRYKKFQYFIPVS